jgi:hypothetical protein
MLKNLQYFFFKKILSSFTIKSGGMVMWLMNLISYLRFAGSMGSNPDKGKPLFPLARDFILIAQYLS